MRAAGDAERAAPASDESEVVADQNGMEVQTGIVIPQAGVRQVLKSVEHFVSPAAKTRAGSEMVAESQGDIEILVSNPRLRVEVCAYPQFHKRSQSFIGIHLPAQNRRQPEIKQVVITGASFISIPVRH